MANIKEFVKERETALGWALIAGVASVALSGCSVSQTEKDDLRKDLTDRNLNVMSIGDSMGNLTAQVSFGDKGCIGSYNADVATFGEHNNSLAVEVGVPGSPQATQTVIIDNPTLERLRHTSAIAEVCFSDGFSH